MWSKAQRIHSHSSDRQAVDSSGRSGKPRIIIPSSEASETLSKANTPYDVVQATGTCVGDLVRMKRTPFDQPNSAVYRIPCSGCESSYYGETSKGLEERVKQHQADMRYCRTTNAMVTHRQQTDHVPNWHSASVIYKGECKRRRKVLESILIATSQSVNLQLGDTPLASLFAQVVREKVGEGRSRAQVEGERPFSQAANQEPGLG